VGAPRVWRADSIVTDIPGASAAGDLNFTIPAGATRLSDGTVVIGDLHGGAVRYFDEAGRQVASFGRFGEGPGEFGQVNWLGQCAADTVLVWDTQLSRLTVLDRRGWMVHQDRIPMGEHRMPPLLLACAPGGPLAALRLPSEPVSGTSDGRSPMYRGRLDFLDDRGRVTQEAGDASVGETQVLGRLTKMAVAPGVLYVGTAESAAVDVYDSTGLRVGSVGVGSVGREVTQPLWEHAVDERLWQLAQPVDRATRDWMLGLPRPKYLPPYSALAADPEGILWASLSFSGDTTTVLRGVRPAGSEVADILLPKYVSVLEVGVDYVLGIHADETGELHVVVFRLGRSP